jgi:hypothetical protein
MLKVMDHSGPSIPSSLMGSMNTISTITFNLKSSGFKTVEMKIFFTSTFLGGRNIIKKYVGASIWPFSHDWKPVKIVYLTVDWTISKVPFQLFELQLPEGTTLGNFFSEVEKRVCDMVREFTLNEYKASKI